MKTRLVGALPVVALLWFGGAAFAQDAALVAGGGAQPAAKATAGARKPHLKRKPVEPAPSSSAANLNAPAMNFDGVTPEIDDPKEARRRGGGRAGGIKPSMTDGGRPQMGLGF